MSLAANALGVIKGKFTIPANVPAGTKEVIATGAQGSRGGAVYVGDGTITSQVLHSVTSVTTT
jgi:hypothetical protein